MGIVSLSLSQSNNMKFLLVLAVAAYVKAEADPAFVYSTAGVIPHVLPYAHVAYPYVHAAPAAAEAEAVETVAKREAEPVAEATAEADAEADPEADPWLYYSGLMDMDMDTMDMLHSPTAMLHTPTPMSTLTMASHTLTTHTPTMERDLLMLSQRPRLMLTHISSMVDTTDLTLIMPVTTHT